MRELSQCGHFADRGGGRVNFSRFCAEVFFRRPLIELHILYRLRCFFLFVFQQILWCYITFFFFFFLVNVGLWLRYISRYKTEKLQRSFKKPIDRSIFWCAWWEQTLYQIHLKNILEFCSTNFFQCLALHFLLCKFSLLGGGAIRPLPRDGGVEELHGDPTVGPRPKVWTRGQKRKKWCRRWRRRGSDTGQSRRRWVRSCIGKRTKEGCDRGSEVEPVHSG